jgi:hypothetical protein
MESSSKSENRRLPIPAHAARDATMTNQPSLKRLADGTPAPLTASTANLPETEADPRISEWQVEATCLELAAVLNVGLDQVAIQNRALHAGTIYPFYYEVGLESSGAKPQSLRMAITPDLQGAFLTFLSPALRRVDDVVDLLRAHRVPSPDRASIRAALEQAESRNGPVPWVRIPNVDTPSLAVISLP